MAPSRCAMIDPGVPPRREPSSWAPKRCTACPSRSARTPGVPSAAWILRSTACVSSQDQSMARDCCFMKGRRCPRAASAQLRCRQRLLAPAELRQRFANAGDRSLGHLAAIEAALGREAHRKFRVRPDRAGVHFGHRLQHGNAPLALAFLDRPVERRRPAVAGRTGVDDRARDAGPDVLGDGAFQERRDNHVRLGKRHRFARHRVVHVEL